MALEAPVFATRPRSAGSRLLVRMGMATAPRDAGVRAVNTPGNRWQVPHAREIERLAGGRT